MSDHWHRIAQTSGSKIYAALIGILTLSITARALGPEGRGQVAMVVTWVGLFSTLGSISLGQIALHRAASRSPEWFPKAMHVLVWATLVASLASWAVVAGLQASTSLFAGLQGFWLWLGFLMLPAMLWDQHGGALLMAREQLHMSNQTLVIGRTLTVILVISLVGYGAWGVTGAIVATLLGYWASSSWTFIHLWIASAPRLLPPQSDIQAYLRDGFKLHLNAIGAFLISGMDILMVGHFLGPSDAGVYQLAVQLITMLLIVPQSVAMVAYGAVSRDGPRAGWLVHRKLVVQTVALMTALACVAGVTAPWWIALLAGPTFAASADVFRWLLVGAVGSTFSLLMAPQWIARGFFAKASFLTILVGTANFLGNLALIPRFGVWGAVASSLVCGMLAIAGNVYMVLLCQRDARTPESTHAH